MSPLPIQKNLTWAQRFWNHVAMGPIGEIRNSLSLDHDWPLETRLIRPEDYVTIAGTVATDLYVAPTDQHAIGYLASVSVVAVAIPAGDRIGLLLRSADGDGVRVYEQSGVAVPVGEMIPLVGNSKTDAATLGTTGGRPVYVGPGQSLRIVHTSAAGGSTVRPRLWIVERNSYYPLRLP